MHELLISTNNEGIPLIPSFFYFLNNFPVLNAAFKFKVEIFEAKGKRAREGEACVAYKIFWKLMWISISLGFLYFCFLS